MNFLPEFQAVVLAAGKGSRMPEITAGKPKCLLPVGPKPLLWYPLYKLQQTGFTDVILIVAESQKSEIQTTLDKCDLEIKIDYTTISSNEDLGTADSLRLIQDKLKSDVIVVSCDLITEISLQEVVNLFRSHDASMVALLFHPQSQTNLTLPGPKSKHKPEKDLIGIDTQTNRLVFLASASDFETELSLPKSLFRKHTSIKMYSNLIDSHIYVLKNWIVKYLCNEPNISTLKGELLPHIIKKQLARPPKTQEFNQSVATRCDNEDIFYYAQEDEFNLLIRETSSYNDHKGDLKPVYHGDSIRCYAQIASPKTLGLRVNTLPNYWAVNNNIQEVWSKVVDVPVPLRHPKAEIKSTQVDEKCCIWEGAKLNEKTSFKNALIGSNTQVASFSRVFNSIVMNNVTIKEKVALENCIVCDGATIENGCQIKNCLVGSNHVVPSMSEHNHEVLTDSDRLMEF